MDERAENPQIRTPGRDGTAAGADYVSEREIAGAHPLDSLLNSIPVPVFHKDAAGIYRGCNRAFEAAMGLQRDQILGRTAHDVAPVELAEQYQEMDASLLRVGGAQRYETRVRYGDGSEREVVFHKALLRGAGGEAAGIVGTMIDVTEERRASRLLKQSNQKLTEARDDERRRLARELHDSIGQELIALQMQLGQLREEAGRAGAEPTAKRLDEILSQCRRVTDEVRQLCRGLYPGTLDAFGLVASLQQLQRDLEGLVTLELDVEETLEQKRFDSNTELALYRIAQEAVSNAVQHGHAKRIDVQFSVEGGSLVLEVRDDGMGFNVADQRGCGLGLRTMSDRAEALGGAVQFGSEPEGTTVKARVPISSDSGDLQAEPED